MLKHNQILIVDDDTEDHLIMMEYFTDFGISDKVHFTDNGKNALEYLEAITDDNFLPRLIVLDLNMPILNGTQTLLQMKQISRFKDIPVIIFSTSENENEKRKCLSFGATDYMVKPTTLDEGRQIVKIFTSFVD